MLDVKAKQESHEEDRCCFPELVRMNYFHGQMLSPRDFLAEQAYHRAKDLLINRCLHGHGVVCGLHLTAEAAPEPCPDPNAEKRHKLETEIAELQSKLAEAEKKEGSEQEVKDIETRLEELRRELEKLGVPDCPPQTKEEVAEPKRKVKLGCGFAIAPDGHEIVVSSAIEIDLDDLIGDEGWQRIEKDGEADAWLSICYAECGFETVRPGKMDQCEIVPGCQDARVREGWTLKLSFDEPPAEERCEACCECFCDSCVLLARLHLWRGAHLNEIDVHTSVRREFGVYPPTVITGINWRHGETYAPKTAAVLSGADDGAGAYEIRFSRPLRVNSIRPGVIELLNFSGGQGEAGTVRHRTGEFVDLPASGFTDRIRYRDTTGEWPQRGDRILIVVRCAFLLDACCRAPDGTHIGGRVPDFTDEDHHSASSCAYPPSRPGAPWTSGGAGYGTSFESWIFISREKEARS